MTGKERPKSKPKSGGNKPRGGAAGGKGPRGSNGQGAGSALAEMLRRQAQNPRPGVQQQPRAEVRDLRESRGAAPRKPRG
jgi:hypothetical protein